MVKIQINKTLQGFSLVEIIVVLAIIGLLVGIAIPAILAAQRSSRQTAQEAVINTIRTGYSSNYTKTAINSYLNVNSCPTSTFNKSNGRYENVGSNVGPNQVYFVVSAPGPTATSPVECVRFENKSQFTIQRRFVPNATASSCQSNASSQTTVVFIDNGNTLFYCNEDGVGKEFPYKS